MDQELYNQAVLACTVVPQLVHLGSTQSVDSAALTALRASAKKLQKHNIDTNGTGTPLLSIPLHQVDAYIADIISSVDGGLDTIARLGATINGKKIRPEVLIRQWAGFGLRRLTASRAQDLRGYLKGTEKFVGGSSYSTADSVQLVFYEPKENNRDDMNPHQRPRSEAASGKFSSVVKLSRPRNHAVPWFDIFELLMRSTDDRNPPTIVTNRGNFTRAFLGANTRSYKDTEMQTSTLSSEALRLMIDAGAVEANGNLKARHIRHSTLSMIHQWAGVLENRKSMMDFALQQSRHSVEVFLSQYLLEVPEESRAALDLLPLGATWEDILLAAPSQAN